MPNILAKKCARNHNCHIKIFEMAAEPACSTMQAMSVAEVGAWLSAHGLGELQALFAREQISGSMLAALTDADLKGLGVTAFGHRRKILALKQNSKPHPIPAQVGRIAEAEGAGVEAGSVCRNEGGKMAATMEIEAMLRENGLDGDDMCPASTAALLEMYGVAPRPPLAAADRILLGKPSSQTTTKPPPPPPAAAAASSVAVDDGKPPVIVVDVGTQLLRAGFAAADAAQLQQPPAVSFASAVARKASSSSSSSFEALGDDAVAKARTLRLTRAVARGVAADVDALEALLLFAFNSLLGGRSALSARRVLLVDSVCAPARVREALATLLFNKFGVGELCIASAPMLEAALLPSGTQTAVVADVGAGAAQAMPLGVPNAAQRAEVAGTDVTDALASLLAEYRGYSFTSDHDKETCRKIKERHAYVLPTPPPPLAGSGGGGGGGGPDEDLEDYHELPDGTEIGLGRELHECAEPLFAPETGVSAAVIKAIDVAAAGNRDAWTGMLGNVFVAGGTSAMRGFPERLQAELSALSAGTPVRVVPLPQRGNAAWTAGAVVSATQPEFLSTFVSRAAFDELGAAAVVRKFVQFSPSQSQNKTHTQHIAHTQPQPRRRNKTPRTFPRLLLLLLCRSLTCDVRQAGRSPPCAPIPEPSCEFPRGRRAGRCSRRPLERGTSPAGCAGVRWCLRPVFSPCRQSCPRGPAEREGRTAA